MPVSMAQVLTEIDKDEPDYGAAARLGPEALPHLRELVEAEDPMLASKAAYLAGLIGGNEAAPVLELAAAHRDPTVRVALAHAVGAGKDTPTAIIERLLDDGDSGVRKVALRAAKSIKSSPVRKKVSAMAKDDPEEFIRNLAKDVAKGQ
jgi:HEAT repeat protein